MAWPHLDGIIKVVVSYGFDGQPSVNVHFVLQRSPSSPIAAGIMESAADAMWNAIDTEWKGKMGDAWTMDNITATDWSLPDGEQVITTEVLPIEGTGAAEEVPASVAIVVSHRSTRTGRSRRGRNYVPGLTEESVGGNSVDGLTATAALDLYTAFDSGLDAVNLDHVIYSLYSDNAPRVTPVTTIVTSRIANLRVDTQRRRLPS